MKYNPSTFTDFVDKESFFVEALKHTKTVGITNENGVEETLYLWATELPNNKMQIRSVTKRDPVKNILISSSSQANESIRRLFDQILFDSDRKFGGSSELAVTLPTKIMSSFTDKHKGQFLPDKAKEWLTILFEEIIPKEFAPKALPNTSDTFALAMQNLYNFYDEELVNSVVKAAIAAGSGGNIIVQQSPYYGKFSITKGNSGYQFKTFEQSKMFHGLQRFKHDKAVSFTNPKILLVNGAVEDFSEIEELLDEAAKLKQPFVIIADRISDEIYDVLKLNFDKNVVDCFAIETKNDYVSVNTIIDVGVISNKEPITPYTIHSEFIMAKWDNLPTIDEIIFSKDGKVTFKNASTEQSVRNHIKKIAAKRQEISFDEFAIKEPNFTARIQNLTTAPTYLFIPYKTEAEGETKRIQVDTLLRFLKSVISYGVVNLEGTEKQQVIDKLYHLIQENEKEIFIRHRWFFEEVLSELNGITPYLHIVGARRLIANHMTQILGVSGMIIRVE